MKARFFPLSFGFLAVCLPPPVFVQHKLLQASAREVEETKKRLYEFPTPILLQPNNDMVNRVNPFRKMLILAGNLMSPFTRMATVAKAKAFDAFAEKQEDQEFARHRGARRTKSSSISQYKKRKNRRRAHAAGCKKAFA